MIDVNGCSVDIVPVIKGFSPDALKIRKALENEYDVVSVQLGPEDIEALTKRAEITDDPELSDLELVYTHFLMNFGDVVMPTPAYTELVDICTERSVPVIPLDMDDAEYSDVYCDTVSAMELLKETKLAKKFYKNGKFDMDSAESFVLDWDRRINKIKGLRMLSEKREAYTAGSIKKHSAGKKSMLAVVEFERAAGIMRILNE